MQITRWHELPRRYNSMAGNSFPASFTAPRTEPELQYRATEDAKA